MKRQAGIAQRGKAKRSGDRASRTRPQTITRYRIALVQEPESPYGKSPRELLDSKPVF